MNEELHNDQDQPEEADNAPLSVCARCKKNPCVCPDKEDSGEKNSSGNSENNSGPAATKPPKICWI